MAIDYKPNQNDYKNLTPFKIWLMNQINTWGQNNFPFVESDFDDLTNYAMMQKLMNAVNDVIANENLVEEDVSNLFNAYTELQNYINNYFDNLDVQDEINQKLDEMAEDGTLYDLISRFTTPIIEVQNQNIEEMFDEQNNRINTSLSSMQSQINSVSSGSPSGVYATLTDLKSANPSHSKIYLVSADGKWYYFNTTDNDWVEGGTYQSTGIADGSIGYRKLDANLQNMIVDFGENLAKDPNNNGSLSYLVSQTNNATITLVETPSEMTGAVSNKSMRIQTSAQGGFVRLDSFYKSLTYNVTKISISAYIYVPTGRLNMIVYNKTTNTSIKATGNTSGNLFKVLFEDIPITAITNVIIAIQGTYAQNDIYITDLTIVEGTLASPSFIAYNYIPDTTLDSVLRNKNILIFGDSITDCCNLTINSSNQTTAYTWKNPSNSYVNENNQSVNYSMWPRIIKDNYGCKEIRNYALYGAHWRNWSGIPEGLERQNLSYQIQVALNDRTNPNNVFNQSVFNPDIIIFALGTNDNVPTSGDTYEVAMKKSVYYSGTDSINVDATINNLDLNYFYQSMRWAFLKVKQQWPMAQIYVVLPIQRADREPREFNEMIKKMSLRYSAIVIDGAGNSGITREFNIVNGLGTYLKDGLHPNEKGQNLMARLIIKSLLNNYMDFSRMNQ